MKFTRRDFIVHSAITAGSALLGCSNRDEGQPYSKGPIEYDRPNVLLVLVDQERQPRHTRPIHTPNRDRLKKHAVDFTNAYCTYPLCSPSRATILTGRYPHEAGILMNCDPMAGNSDMSPAIPTLGRVMSQAGYRSGYFGKWHLSGLTRSRTMPERYGFDEAFLSNQVVGIGSDEYFARRTGKWIRRESARGPWFAVYSPLNPHDICYPVLKHFYSMPGNDDKYATRLPPNYSKKRSPHIRTVRDNTSDFEGRGLRGPFNDEYFRQYIDFYCFLIEEVDRCLGILLDDLEKSGQWDNTIVIYTSDHGEMAGSHGLQNKGTTMYEENLAIPLMISHPGLFKGYRRSPDLVSNIDLVPTITAMTGVEWPEPLRGNALLSASGKPIAGLHDHLYAEGGVSLNASWRGIHTDRWKYWHYTETGEELLFNVMDDPNELVNLAGDRGYSAKVREYRKAVRSWRRATADPINTFLT